MDIFKGQTANAEKAYEWRKEIPEKLNRYLDFRPKATGITLVSFFDFAPMRGLQVNPKNIRSVLNILKRRQDFLISPAKSDEEKIEILQNIGFKARAYSNEEYLEEDVQAFLAREILSYSDKDMPQRIANSCNFSGLKYLTSEFEWSSGGVDRVDILCCDKDNYYKILIIELKKIRTTQLKQTRYLGILRKKSKELIRFISVLTGKKLNERNPLDIHMVYLMPSHPHLEIAMWEKIAVKHGIDGIIFYNTGYPCDRIVLNKKSACS